MDICPYCKSPMPKTGRLVRPLSKRQETIYKAVLESADDGVKAEHLAKLIGAKGPGGRITLRVAIHDLNRKIIKRNQRIRGIAKVYRLVPADEW